MTQNKTDNKELEANLMAIQNLLTGMEQNFFSVHVLEHSCKRKHQLHEK